MTDTVTSSPTEQKTVTSYVLDRLMDSPGLTGADLLIGRPAYIASTSVAPVLTHLRERGVLRRSKTTSANGRGTFSYWIHDLDKLPTNFTEVRKVPPKKSAVGVTVVKSFTEAAEVIDNRSSLVSEGSVLNHIRMHPGRTSTEILSTLNPADRSTKIFQILSRLERDGKIRAEFVVENDRRKRRFYPAAAYSAKPAAPAPTTQQPTTVVNSTPPAPRPSEAPKVVHPTKGAPILRVAVGDRSYSMTVPEWREVYEELKSIFA